MAAIITLSTNALVKKLSSDYPDLKFIKSDNFAWNPLTKTINYISSGPPTRLLHELGHAKLEHKSYSRDIELLKMERNAWDEAVKLAKKHELTISDAQIDEHIDSYRDWLHQRSLCPNCQANGIQTAARDYRCIECQQTWRVNDARRCLLKRYKTNTPAV